jgi:hypothetical protein
MSSFIGTLSQAGLANIIDMDGFPLENIEELLDVNFVMKGGKDYKDHARPWMPGEVPITGFSALYLTAGNTHGIDGGT